MNKKFLSLLIVIIVVGGAVIYFIIGRVLQPASISPTSVSQSNQISSSPPIIAPVDILSGERINQGSILVNSSTQTKVTFKELTDELHRGRSPFYEVFVNENKIGDAGGYLMMPSFSPDGKFLAFRSMWIVGCAANCFDSSIYIVNLTDHKMTHISPPRKAADYSGFTKIPSGEVDNAIIEPYGWNTNALNVIFYYAGYSYPSEDTQSLCSDGVDNDNDGAIDLADQDCKTFASPATSSQVSTYPANKYYRVSPKELWHYDLTTKQYTFLEMLSE